MTDLELKRVISFVPKSMWEDIRNKAWAQGLTITAFVKALIEDGLKNTVVTVQVKRKAS